MTPSPVEDTVIAAGYLEDDICITGIAGSFPNSRSVKHLAENLFNKVDLISDDERRWRKDHPEIPQRTGKVYDEKKFDASFFGFNYKQAHSLDPMCRLLLERIYECLIDAGLNPCELRNTNTGVFTGACISENEKIWTYEKTQVSDNGGLGCFHSLLANMITQWLNLKGPSYCVDTACSSSLYAMDQAFKSIRDGHCDAAIVAGINLCLHPSVSLIFYRMGILSPDGRCKSFDNCANGYVRSESIVACFLQRAKDSRRVYAKLLHTKTNCDGYKVQGITYPAGHIQKLLLEQFYVECGIPPSRVEFMEAHGTGTSVGDPEELGAIDEVFCKGRKAPLLIGSIKSNLGHSEGSSGMNSLAKACIAYNTGNIPPNINFVIPREECPSLMEGRLRVVTEKQPWNRGLFAMSSFGFGGANAHILLENFSKTKINNGIPSDGIPRLVCVSGRTEPAVARVLSDLASRPVDKDEVRLWHAIHERDIPRHYFRGFILLDSTSVKGKRLLSDIGCITDVPKQRSVWLKYTDLRTLWPAIAKQCMMLPAFVNAIHKCCSALRCKGVDLVKLFDEDIPRQRELAIVGSVAVYIGLTDVIKAVGIKPDYVVSYDIGELCCAYADEHLTAEQTMLAAYEINMSIKNILADVSVIKVRLDYKTIANICPAEAYVEYDKDSNCSAIVASTSKIQNLANLLAAKCVPVEHLGYNNSIFYEYLNKTANMHGTEAIFPIPANRSKRWVSSYCQSENFVNTDENAVVIEIGLESDLENSNDSKWFKKNDIFIRLLKENTNFVESILAATGRLYLRGLNVTLANLYPAVSFPVAQGTPMMSHLVGWDHRDNWTVANFKEFFITKIPFGQKKIKFYMADDRHDYLAGHTIDDRVIFPATGYLHLVWEAFANMTNRLFTRVSVVFEEVYFQRATNIPKEGVLEFTITIHNRSGTFEITENKTTIVTGRIRERSDIDKKSTKTFDISRFRKIEDNCNKILSSKDFYKELNIRGYQYKGLFRGVRSCSVNGTTGQLAWNNNWITFIDTMLQVKIVSQDTRALYVPTRIEKITIDTDKHRRMVADLKLSGNDKLLKFESFPEIDMTRAGGVEVRGVHVTSITKRPPKGIPVLEKNLFIANFCNDKMALSDLLRCNIQLIHENIQTYKFKNIEFVDEEYKKYDLKPISENIAQILADLPLVQAEMVVISNESLNLPPNITVSNKKLNGESNTTLFIGANLLRRQNVLQEAVTTLKKDCFVMSRENYFHYEQNYAQYNIITVYFTESEYFVLLRSKTQPKPTNFIQINTRDSKYSWIDEVKNELRKEQQRLVLYTQNEPVNGLLGLVNCLRKEPGGEVIRALVVADSTAPAFSSECNFYKEHLGKDLGINVFKNGQWGTYRHLLLEELETIPTIHAYANTATVGDINSLRFWEGRLSQKQTSINEGKTIGHDTSLFSGLSFNVELSAAVTCGISFRHPTTKSLIVGCVLVHYKVNQEKTNYGDCIWLHAEHVQAAYVYCSALNFRDAMIALGRVTVDAVARGRLAQDCVQGLEVSGRLGNGTRIMGTCSHAISNLVEFDPSLFWPIPEEWSFEEAATVPVAYLTVYMAMILIGKIRPGERILIHAGSGGVGQAAISVALHYGLEVFTTVGTPTKRAFIKRLYPQIKDSHIGNSRDTSFEHMVKQETNGEGVDLVLNSLADEKLQASVKCLRRGGRFLEIGKYDITINTPLEMCFLQKEISFHSIMLDYIGEEDSYGLRMTLRDLVLNGIESGAVRPLTNCSFEKSELQTAYRYMAAGKHIGKIVIKMREEEPPGTSVKPTPVLIDAVPRYICSDVHVYILVGGLGGFGLELADWLVLRGARKILMSSRRGISNGYQALRSRIWKSYGVELQISTHDVATESGCEEMLKTAAAMGPVKAIFNLAVILNDAVFQNQTPETFNNSFGPKALTTIFLDKLSRIYCPELKDFVIFSSVSCGRGNAGQTNYGFSNSVMERICEERKKAGLPAKAIQWGAIGDVGLVADMQEENVQLEIGGTLQQRISSCLQVLDKFLKQDVTIVSSIVVAEKRLANAGVDSIVEVIAHILGISDLKAISQQAPLSEMGMDSVMAVEIKQTLERDYEVFLSAQEIRLLTFAKLSELVAKDSTVEVTKSASTLVKSTDVTASGLEIFVRHFGDEKTASEPYVYLKSSETKSEDSSTGLRNVLFMLPGIESCATTFKFLCSNINTETCVLQLGLNYEDDVEQTVNGMYKTVKPHLCPGAPYSLLGYSFGSIPILKLAARLENEGHRGIVLCVDGSPEYLKSLVNEFLTFSDNVELQNRIICHSFSMVCPGYNANQTLMSKLKDTETFEDRIKCAIELAPNQLEYSDEFMFSMAKVTFNRIKMISNFDMTLVEKINSPIVLLRTKKVPLNIHCGEDYGLHKFTNNNVTVHHIDANHSNITESGECARLINGTLCELYAENKNVSII